MSVYKKRYEEWLNRNDFDEWTKEELQFLKGNEEEIADRFHQDLAFGTAGMRGKIGVGTNRMNRYVVQRATQGLANALHFFYPNKDRICVAIAYDSRRMSQEFAEEAALTLAGNQIKAYLYPSLRPTPQLSFTVRELSCQAGINITASHNPPEYNGYKVYWSDGAQFSFPYDKKVKEEVDKITDFSSIHILSKKEAIQQGLFEEISADLDERYEQIVLEQRIHPEISNQTNIKIVYTPLHGTGNIPVCRVLKKAGYTNLYVVPEQEMPDGNFPTVSSPNPESAEAFSFALNLAKEKDADIVLATDPDADRLGIYVKHQGEYRAFTGNQSGAVLAEYLLSQKKAMNILDSKGMLFRSIVTTKLLDAVGRAYEIPVKEVLTGFKYIGQQILALEEQQKYTYLFGMEESYGCLVGTYARDKDAVSAALLLTEAAAYYLLQGKTLWDVLEDMYQRYGYYVESVYSIELEGISGLQRIQAILDYLRKNPLNTLDNYCVEKIRDYQQGWCLNLQNHEKKSLDLEKTNVLYYELEEDTWLCVRPSGTEPKIKFYFGTKQNSLSSAEQKIKTLEKAILHYVQEGEKNK
ncbi:phosphomannomutase [Clostridia bacterium]|nr:phosphomannomutase [Clostridia bacterium]